VKAQVGRLVREAFLGGLKQLGKFAFEAYSSPSEPETTCRLDAHPRFGSALDSSTASAPSLSRYSLRRQSSAIRTRCANKRPSGSGRGVPGNWYPYRDLITGSER
jgi:hypothetical protein